MKALQAFQSYLISQIITGDPNVLRDREKTIEWPVTSGQNGSALGGVLNFTGPVGPGGFEVVTSNKLVKDRCEFWDEVWMEIDRAIVFPGGM